MFEWSLKPESYMVTSGSRVLMAGRLGRLPADSGARESGRFPVDAQNEVVAVIFYVTYLGG